MDNKVRSTRLEGPIYWYLASIGIPKSMHCLCLKLAKEYSVNALARSPLPPPEFIYHLTDNALCHFAILTNNVLAASAVVSSAVRNTISPEKMVFHVITDKKTYTTMHAWYALHPGTPAVPELKGMQKYDWPIQVKNGAIEMAQIHRSAREHYYHHGGEYEKLEALRPSCSSLMNHLHIYLPDVGNAWTNFGIVVKNMGG